MTTGISDPRARSLQGSRAGFVSQAVAALVDSGAVVAAYFVGLCLFGFVRFLVTSRPLSLPRPAVWLDVLIVGVLAVVILASAWSGSGRSAGMSVVGLRVLTVGGRPLSPPRAWIRALLFVLTLGLGLLTVTVSRRNASLYDMVCATAVVYQWQPSRSR